MGKRKLCLTFSLLLFFFSATISYLILQIEAMVDEETQQMALANSEVAQAPTFIWQEAYEVCSLYELDCAAKQVVGDKEKEEELAKLELQEIAKRYSLPEWSVSTHNQDIFMTKYLSGLCPKHKKVYHFGINSSGDYLTVFYGPSQVENDGGVYLLTDIAWQDISLEEQEKISQGKYEFYLKEDMIVALDSFSELAKKDE